MQVLRAEGAAQRHREEADLALDHLLGQPVAVGIGDRGVVALAVAQVQQHLLPVLARLKRLDSAGQRRLQVAIAGGVFLIQLLECRLDLLLFLGGVDEVLGEALGVAIVGGADHPDRNAILGAGVLDEGLDELLPGDPVAARLRRGRGDHDEQVARPVHSLT